jgi:hypothetical protein
VLEILGERFSQSPPENQNLKAVQDEDFPSYIGTA